MNFQNQSNQQNQNMLNNYQASQNRNQNLTNQNLTNQNLNNQNLNNQNLNNQNLTNQAAQLQNESMIAAQGYNPQQDLELAAEMGQKSAGEIQRILASKAVTGIEFGYVPFPESGPNQMNNQNLNNQYNANAFNNMNNNQR